MGRPAVEVDYELFKQNEERERKRVTAEWDRKHHSKRLPVLIPGQRVWVNAPTDIGKEGVVLRADSSPDSYWVRVGMSEIRRNRKHLFLLHDDSYFSEKSTSIRPLELEDSNGPLLGHDVSLRVPPAAQGPALPVTPTFNGHGSEGSSNNQPVADNISAFDIVSASASTASENALIPASTPRESVLNYTSEKSSRDTANTNSEMNTPNEELFVEQPSSIVRTRYGRVVKPAKRDGYTYY